MINIKSIGIKKHSALHKMRFFIYPLLLFFLFIKTPDVIAQTSRRVLFLGNSYTGVNNLPQLVYNTSLSTGDTLIFDSHTPGGYQLLSHYNDVTSQNKIMAGTWDYVVIQGQSQEPITLYNQFITGAMGLYNLIKQYNSCAITMPYMTWGRKNGDATNCTNFPMMCTYQGMDTTLRNRYLNLTNYINGEVSPVSIVWNFLRQNYPSIELYQADESHPSIEGSYAAACCFYTAIFKKDPTLITFNSSLNANDAAIIKNAVKTQVFDNLHLWDFKKPPVSDFNYQIGTGINQVIFNSISQSVQQTYYWDFGDATSSSAPYPTHSYLTNGTYMVSLTTTTCDLQGLHTSFRDTVIQFCNHTPSIYTYQPWLCNYDTLWTETADSYQWVNNGILLPETNQYLANYAQYGMSGFSVISSINSCSELSQLFTNIPQWSDYYFDALGNPCNGDTVAFAVLHTNGFLSGSENIFWYKNDTLLLSMNNEDTLFITTEGKYECKIINPNSNCPLDTTSQIIEYNCSGVGINEKYKKLFWTVFPNPATESTTIKFTNPIIKDEIEIYNVMGLLIKSYEVTQTTTFTVTELPSGIYFIRLKNDKQSALKFIKQ